MAKTSRTGPNLKERFKAEHIMDILFINKPKGVSQKEFSKTFSPADQDAFNSLVDTANRSKKMKRKR